MIKYSVDANAFIDLERQFKRPYFDDFWDKFVGKVESDCFFSPEPVLEEIGKLSSGVYTFVSKYKKKIFVPYDDYIDIAKQIHKDYPELTSYETFGEDADPFVIALAKKNNFIVLTDEKQKPTKVNIPFVCDKLGVKHCDIWGFLDHEKWKFNLTTS